MRAPLDIRVPKAPIAASVGDRSLLVYELRVTNLGARDLAIQRLDISGDGTPLSEFEGDSLRKITDLHFHVGDRPSPLGAEGVPYRFEQYAVLGMTAGFPAPWMGGGTPLRRPRAMPLDNQVILFQP